MTLKRVVVVAILFSACAVGKKLSKEPEALSKRSECKDDWPPCPAYKASCETDANVKRLCKKTCGECTGDANGDECKDDWPPCPAYKASCETDANVKRLCKKTCGECTGDANGDGQICGNPPVNGVCIWEHGSCANLGLGKKDCPQYHCPLSTNKCCC